MVVFTLGVIPDLEYHGTEAAATPPDRADLFRIVILSVDEIDLVENFFRFLRADPVVSLNGPACRSIEFNRHRRI